MPGSKAGVHVIDKLLPPNELLNDPSKSATNINFLYLASFPIISSICFELPYFQPRQLILSQALSPIFNSLDSSTQHIPQHVCYNPCREGQCCHPG